MTSEPRPESAQSATERAEPESTSEPGSRPEPVAARVAGRPEAAKYAERCYRSPAAMAGGVVLLVLGVWLGGDALVNGGGRTPWVALAGLFLLVPLVAAYTLRPAVFAGEERMRVRNPFRTVDIPWGTVEAVRSGYSSEVVAGGVKYQLWAVPVSLRARSRAARHNERVSSGRPPARGGLFGLGGPPVVGEEDPAEKQAPSDRTIGEIRELSARHAGSAPAQGTVTVRWAYEILAPALAGAVATAFLAATG